MFSCSSFSCGEREGTTHIAGNVRCAAFIISFSLIYSPLYYSLPLSPLANFLQFGEDGKGRKEGKKEENGELGDFYLYTYFGGKGEERERGGGK